MDNSEATLIMKYWDENTNILLPRGSGKRQYNLLTNPQSVQNFPCLIFWGYIEVDLNWIERKYLKM